jgi:hypothetical protein
MGVKVILDLERHDRADAGESVRHGCNDSAIAQPAIPSRARQQAIFSLFPRRS